jgi:N utilization substance protein B
VSPAVTAELSARERIDRYRAREWALQIHYRWESGGKEGTFREALSGTLATRRIAPTRLPYLRRLMETLDGHLPALDRTLQAALENWRLQRLSSIDRGILRIAAAEMMHMDDIPPKVSIQEGIRLAELYGGPESPRFVNGVLDALYKQRTGARSGL